MDTAIIGYFGFYGSMAEYVADAWESNGHKVTKYNRNVLPDIGLKHQLYIFVDCSEDYSSKIPYTFAPQVFWSMDAQMPGGIERSTNIGRKCDLVFSSNKEFGVDLLAKFGVDSYLLPITYSDRLLHVKTKKEKDLDVAMIGNPNSSLRIELWDLLQSRYKAYTGRAEKEKVYKDVMQRAKIVVNQPTEPFDNILNNRFFEGMASNALVLQKRLKTTLIEDLGFIETKDFLYWDTFEQLTELIDYYSVNDSVRKIIAKSGNSYVKQYSMKQQCKKMEKLILQDLPIK
jgi:hypothetical protein